MFLSENDSTLLIACENADIPLARKMIRSGARNDARNDMGESALHMAVKSGDPAMLKFVLNELHPNPDVKDVFSRTALHWAAQRGNLEMVELLLLARADINAKDDSGFPAITYAERAGRQDIVKILTFVLASGQ